MKRFKNILCVVNTDLKDNAALEHAAKLAEKNQASLTVIEVIDDILPNTTLYERTLSSADLQAQIVMEHQRRLDDLISPWKRKIEIESRVLTGITFLEIIHEVLRNGYDLVFKVAERCVMVDRVFGSDDMHLLRKCPCPVWLIKPESPKDYQRILAAVDVDDNYPSEELNTRHILNHQILKMASALALSEFAELHIVQVWKAALESTMRGAFINRPEDEIVAYVEDEKKRHEKNLNILMDEITGNLGRDTVEYIKPKMHLLKGSPRSKIPELASEINADLVVMGTVARTGIPGLFMGNTAETILNQLNCSVLAIKPPGFVTPVTLED
jgi:universal stress protein E